MVEADEIAFEVAFDDVGRDSAVVANSAHFALEIFDAVERAFAFATRIGTREQPRSPPHFGVFDEKAMDDAVDKWGGDDFASDGVVNNKSNAAAGVISTRDNGVAQAN